MSIFDDLDFLGFVKQKLEEEIDFQEKLIENQRNNFYDKQLDYELCKELHLYQRWRDEVSSYITNKYAVGSNKRKMRYKAAKARKEGNEELAEKFEIKAKKYE